LPPVHASVAWVKPEGADNLPVLAREASAGRARGQPGVFKAQPKGGLCG
jgi:hypothetical protein